MSKPVVVYESPLVFINTLSSKGCYVAAYNEKSDNCADAKLTALAKERMEQ